MSQYFCGQQVTGKVSASPATSFKEVVEIHIDTPVPMGLTQAEYLGLPKEARNAEKRKLSYLTPAVFIKSPCERKTEHALHCNLIFLDIDEEADGTCPAAPYVNNPAALAKQLAPFGFAAYKTVSSTDKKPRLRIMVSAFEIPLEKYPQAVYTIAERIGLKVVTTESKTAVQPMFLPSLFAGQNADTEHPFLIGDPIGEPFIESDISFNEELFQHAKGFTAKQLQPSGDDILAYLRPPVEEITLEVAKEALSHIDADIEYPQWLEIAAGLKHQFSHTQAEEAYELFDEWSQGGTKYTEADDTLAKWNSLQPTPVGRAPVTIRSILHRAVEHGWPAESIKEQCFASTKKWLLDPDRTITDLMVGCLKKIAATPLLSHTEEEALLQIAAKQCKSLHKTPFPVSSLRTDLKKLKDGLNKKDDKPKDVKPDWLKGWAYIAKPNIFFRHRTSEKLPPENFNNNYSKELVPTEEQLEEAGLPITLSNLAKPSMRPQDFALNLHKIQVAYDFEYDPGEPNKIFTKKEGKYYVNTYRKPSIKPSEEGSAEAEALVRQHLEKLLEYPDHQEMMLSWMAFQTQFPGRKIRWCPLIQGAEGCGKTIIYNLMSAVLGKEHCKLVDKSTLAKGWTEWAEGSQLVAIEEIYVEGKGKHDLMNAMKPLITNDEVPVNERRENTRTIRNVTNYIAFSNFHTALSLTLQDRRYFVLKSKIQSLEAVTALRENGYFTTLFDSLKENASGLRYFFENYEISDTFLPNGPPPRTIYLDEVIEDTSDEVTALIRSLIKEAENPLVTSDMIALGALEESFLIHGLRKPTSQYLKSVLRGLGYYKAGRSMIEGEQRQPIWVREGKLIGITDFGALARERLKMAKELEDIW